MKRRWIGILSALILLIGMTGTVFAQTYLFEVPKTEVYAAIQQDGTATIEYYITFRNNPSADPIDYIDVGLPNRNYKISNITADIDGHEIKDIENSPYIDIGIALGLGSNAIQPGKTGVVHLVVNNIKGMVYPSTQDEQEPYAGFEFMPNYFGSEYVKGSTDLKVVLYLPPGLTTEEPRYLEPTNWPGEKKPVSGIADNGMVYYEWHSPDANSASRYTFGAFFPARMIPAEAIVTKPAPTSSFDSDSLFDKLATPICCTILFFVILLPFFQKGKQTQKRKNTYLPPKISIEGHGIKRGLTAVETAVLMETPIEKVMTMILFSVLKKDAASVITKEPLKIEATATAPETLQPYEKDFLTAYAIEDPKKRTKALQEVMVDLVKNVTGKMKGFSLKETRAYYKDIINRAWDQVNTANTPQVKMETFDNYMGWTMLDKDFNRKANESFGAGQMIFLPKWWWNYDPDYRSTYSSQSGGSRGLNAPIGSGSGQASSGPPLSMPTLPGSAFAGSLVAGMQNFAKDTVGNLTSFTSGVTNVTNPPPPPSSYRSSGGGGGSSCACACACAGCACACAGGGR